MMAMSPLSTLNSCGSSSSDVDLTNLPTLVSRSVSGRRLPSASRSSVIVLNLITLKISPCSPGRFWKKNAPVPLLAKCNHMVTNSSTGLRQMMAIREIKNPSHLLMNFLYIILNKYGQMILRKR